ncbi:MAG: glycosyl hydrolase family 2 [Acidobacteriota bacterium]|nr:glycosyl hydrolase family 2 [Acidobacteriota bacterium]
MKRAFALMILPAVIVACACAMRAAAQTASLARPGVRLVLRQGWSVQSSSRAAEPGSVISTAHYQASGWYPTSVPSTVLATLVANKVYPNPDFGMNLRSIPGTTYPIGGNFSMIPMPPDSPFRVGWWYRTQFTLPRGIEGRELWLDFGGINNSASVWLNGHQEANQDQVDGMRRTYEFNITKAALPGEVNTLAVEVFAPTPADLAITFVDWNPLPPDKDMGLFREVYLVTSGPVAVRHPQIVTKFDLPSLDVAHLTVAADVVNATNSAVEGVLKAQTGDIELSQSVSLGPNETKRVVFTPQAYAELNLHHPKLWWPWQYGPQNLERLRMEFETGGEVSDRQSVQYGIREITSQLDAQNHRFFMVNGKKILIRGGGWSPDMMLRDQPQKVTDEIRLARNMNLNTIRLEGKLMGDHFFNVCDREGMLVIAGWCCCSHWERWRSWKTKDYVVAGESLRSQVRRLRNRACILAFFYGSDNAPPPRAEDVYLKVFREEHWPNPAVAAASTRKTAGAGWTGVKMSGPYQYVAPSYWYEDHEHGGAFGFNTETSAGAAIPVLASLKEMMPEKDLWPINDTWIYHTGGGVFKNMSYYTMILNKRYGKTPTLNEYVEKAQVMDYESERAMFEAFGRNKYVSTGVIQWMLDNAWPSMIWHLFDYYLRPGGGFFGAKKACEPLHIQYSYDNQSIAVVNSTLRSYAGYTASAAVFNLKLKRKFFRQARVDLSPDSSTVAFTLPSIPKLSKTYFVRLQLKDASGNVVSRNFYWLSTHPDVSDWGGTKWYYTPLSSYADLTGLDSLPPTSLIASSSAEPQGARELERVTVTNPSRHLAFFVHLTVLKGQGGEDVHPAFWQDNDFELMPGEKRTVTGSFGASELHGAQPVVEVSGWNVKPFTAD